MSLKFQSTWIWRASHQFSITHQKNSSIWDCPIDDSLLSLSLGRFTNRWLLQQFRIRYTTDASLHTTEITKTDSVLWTNFNHDYITLITSNIITNIDIVQYEDIDMTYGYISPFCSQAYHWSNSQWPVFVSSTWTHVRTIHWPIGADAVHGRDRGGGGGKLRASGASDVTSSCSAPPSANREPAGPASRAASTERRSACGRRTWGVPLTGYPSEDSAAPFHGQGTWSYRSRLSDRRNPSSYQIYERNTTSSNLKQI